MSKSALYTSGAVILAFAVWNPVNAQQPGDSGDKKAGVIEEVIVTAQRREQSLQDAAVSVQAFDQDSLTQSGMESAQDLGALSPASGH